MQDISVPSVVQNVVILNIILMCVVMLSVAMLNVIMWSIVMISFVMLNIIVLSVVMLSVIMLSDVIMSIVVLSSIEPSIDMNSVRMLSVVMLNAAILTIFVLSVDMLRVDMFTDIMPSVLRPPATVVIYGRKIFTELRTKMSITFFPLSFEAVIKTQSSEIIMCFLSPLNCPLRCQSYKTFMWHSLRQKQRIFFVMDHIIHIERANRHCQGIACTRTFYMGLTSAEDQKLECFESIAKNIFINNMKIV